VAKNSGRDFRINQKVSKDNSKNKILDEFLRNASVEEMEELYRLLDERDRKKTPGPGLGVKLDLDSIAKNMSKQIQEQLGMANLNMKKMARDLVVQLARQYQPNITDRELAVIVEQMVPGGRKSAVAENLPSDLLMTMVVQFVESDINSGMEWKKRYWEVFPDEIKLGIAGFLRGDIGKDELLGITAAFSKGKGTVDKKGKKKRGMPVPPGRGRKE